MNMINKVDIDVKIYIDKLMEGVNQLGMVEGLAEEFDIQNKSVLKETLVENFTLQASVNMEECGDPTLNENQFGDIVSMSATECLLEEMVQSGSLVKDLGEEGVENVYKINPERKDLLDDEDNEG